jgi:DNA polymerase V
MEENEKVFLLVDCNNFYVSCERVFNPSLIGSPVIVLSGNGGCVIARSNEAKLMGISMGVPFYQIKDLCRIQNVKVFSSNFSFYGDMSARVMNCISSFTPNMEIYSIDEAFLDLTGVLYQDLNDYADLIKKNIYKWTGIPVSVGVAPTKTLAKLGNLFAKRYSANNICNLMDLKFREYVLRLMDISDVWGIGSGIAKRLQEIGIQTPWDLVQAKDQEIKSLFSVVQQRIVSELRGIACLQLSELNAKKSVISSRSFGHVITKIDDLEEELSSYLSRAAIKLRAQNSCASSMYIYIRTNKFDKSNELVYGSKLISFEVPTNNTIDLIKYAKKALPGIYKAGCKYKKAGVMLLDLVDQEQQQHNLFCSVEDKRSRVLMKIMDGINKKMGRGTLVLAAEGDKSRFRPKSEFCSPSYTTNWNHLPKVS